MINYSSTEFEQKYTYIGNDLGAMWSEKETKFRVWAPTAEMVTLNLYKSGYEDDLIKKVSMQQDVNGTWIATCEGDLNHVYYTYSVVVEGVEKEACDPYAKTTGVNGNRAMVLNMEETNPEGWNADASPHAGENFTDAIIYELHVRDLSVDESSGIQNKGKFLGMIEKGTKTASGRATGLDYIKELGITHLQILPSYDYGSVDESRLEVPQFNWGYDPVNYNVPEGSYATDPFRGEARVKEMKQMIQGLHQEGISVVMDVVYNHVYDAEKFCFNNIVPGYFSRIREDGTYSNGSGCGNDTASERSMVKKYIVDSVCYWVEEYHMDGFRFDLMGLIDTVTMNEIVAEVRKNHPHVTFHGEGWTMGTDVTKEGYYMATQLNSQRTPDYAFFNDDIRDGIKGSVLEESAHGYITGELGMTERVKKAILGKSDWCHSPSQTINYASCHDNYALMDRISVNMPEISFEEKVRRNNLGAAIYMLSQGIVLFQAGEEILRTKVDEKGNFVENSYASSDYVNNFKWDVLDQDIYQRTLEYYKGLIQFRKAHKELRYMTAAEVDAHARVLDAPVHGVIAIAVDELLLLFNPTMENITMPLPEGEWKVCINGEKAGVETIEIVENSVLVSPISAMVVEKI